MQNSFLNGLQNETNFTRTENGAVTHKSTLSAVLDMFALGGAYRNRSDEDCILLFKNALEEDEVLALKCLFYLRDCRGGQGERRFFRVCYKWLAQKHADVARRNFELISEYGRYDDVIYTLVGTPLENDALGFIKNQLALDLQCKTPSLLAKWLPSENASAAKTKKMGNIIRVYLGMTHREYRKTLSVLRERINVLERLMSANRWDEIEFDKIPSKAGLVYRNAFARRDVIAKKYEAFAKDENTKVNAKTLNPVDIANQAFGYNIGDVDRAMLQKYWDNQIDYYGGRQENGIAIVDVSGSMSGQPMNAAVSMGAYIAERGHGPFANHFITFSDNPQLVKFEGVDIVDKFRRCRQADWGGSTNIEATFNMMLKVALQNNTPAEDMPERLYIFSDMEFNSCMSCGAASRDRWGYGNRITGGQAGVNTLLEGIAKKWEAHGYQLPKVIFWNLDARQNNIPALGGRFSYVSGFSMNMVECILSGKDGVDLMLEKLNSERYEAIR